MARVVCRLPCKGTPPSNINRELNVAQPFSPFIQGVTGIVTHALLLAGLRSRKVLTVAQLVTLVPAVGSTVALIVNVTE